MALIICKSCKEEKLEECFVKGNSNKWCKACFNIYQRAKYKANPKRYLDSNKKSKMNKPEGYIFTTIKKRAREKGLEFDLEKSDIVIPEYCPVLGIKLQHGNTLYSRDSSPSVDRKDNSKGYTKDNIRIISFRANTLKNNASVEELQKVIKYMES